MTTTHDAARIPAPQVSDEVIARLLAHQWQRPHPIVARLGSERDINIAVDDDAILKIVNPAESAPIAEMQAGALLHCARSSPELPIPAAISTRAGETFTSVQAESGQQCAAWMVTRLPGTDIEGSPINAEIAYQVGQAAGHMQIALQGFFHPAAGRAIGWDLRRLPEYAAGSAQRQQLLERVSPALEVSRHLPSGVQHADVTLSNVLITTNDSGDPIVSGIIDFGDMHHTAHACDLAVTIASVLRNTADQQQAGLWELLAATLDGYQSARLLHPDEANILGELILARLGITDAIAHLHHDRNAGAAAENSHITRYLAANERIWHELVALSPAELSRRIGRLAGTSRSPVVAAKNYKSMTSPGATGLLDRRTHVMGGPLSPLFYDKPLHIVRGQGPWLWAAAGRRLLDAYNNVAVIGHSHPAVTQAVSRQLAALNTHSRYLHSGVVELAERIVSTMPAGLDTVLFTTSGTEANELAWRIATAVTGGNAAIVAEHSYHGSTKWMADLSPLEWPRGYRAPHVGLFRAPHEVSAEAAESTAIQRITDSAAHLHAAGDKPALVLADSMFTSEGILDTPPGFFRGLASGAHTAGALYLADEVQAGYGRSGPQLWRFALADVVPDFVSLGKPMGAGYPLGALVTRRELADVLAKDYEYFSTFAATPVAAAAGLAVLDVLQDQQIPQQAAAVGEYLRQQLRGLGTRHTVLGQVRGIGLMAGVDLHYPGNDPGGARPWAKNILNRLVESGVMAGLTGPTGTVLKVRPPLIWQRKHADIFITALDAVLTSNL